MELFRCIKPISLQVMLSIDRAMICKLKQPGFIGSFFRIELANGSVHVKEYLLYRLFCFAIIAQHTAGYAEDHAVVFLEDHCEGLRMTSLQVGGELFIREGFEIGRRAKNWAFRVLVANGLNIVDLA